MNLFLILDLKQIQYLEYFSYFLYLMFQTFISATDFLSIDINVNIKIRAYDVSYNLHYNNGMHLATTSHVLPSGYQVHAYLIARMYVGRTLQWQTS